MRHTLTSLGALIWFAVTSQFMMAQEQSVAGLPYSKEIAAIDADGLEIPKQRLELSDQNGWLVATLTAEPNDLEWKIVLAKISPAITPVVNVHPKLPLVSVQYGPWFIRESLGRLRVYREPKDFSTQDWKQIGDAPRGETPCTAGRLFVVKQEDWYWACTSPKYDTNNIDTLIRFQHDKLRTGHGSMLFADGQFAEVFCGDARCHDEGDLIVASRITSYGARALLSASEKKMAVVGEPMPSIDGKQMNSTEIPSETKLRGKVVLIDFWATWCGPCVKKITEVNAIQRRFGERGLVVIGVHAKQNSDELATFMEENEFAFPVVLSDGATEERFGVSQFPSYFLVGRDGKIASAHLSNPPTNDEIETELEKR